MLKYIDVHVHNESMLHTREKEEGGICIYVSGLGSIIYSVFQKTPRSVM